jgi:hypothetical protein
LSFGLVDRHAGFVFEFALQLLVPVDGRLQIDRHCCACVMAITKVSLGSVVAGLGRELI